MNRFITVLYYILLDPACLPPGQESGIRFFFFFFYTKLHGQKKNSPFPWQLAKSRVYIIMFESKVKPFGCFFFSFFLSFFLIIICVFENAHLKALLFSFPSSLPFIPVSQTTPNLFPAFLAVTSSNFHRAVASCPKVSLAE